MLFLRLLAAALALAGINGVGIILVDARGRFLLNLRGRRASKPDVAQRLARAILARRWAILGGTIDSGETPEEAALREIREEIGQPVRRLHLVVRVTWPRPVYLYAAGLAVPGEDVLLGEGVEHRFVALDEVSRLSPRAPLLGPVLRAFAGTAAYDACLRDARQAQAA
jgi:8-oxo-dGTP pyrophosphatase MutT (NUDIX family)